MGEKAQSFDLTVTESAAGKLQAALAAEEKTDHAIRVTCKRYGKTRFEYALDFAAPDEKGAQDLEIELANGVKMWVDPESSRHLAQAEIDFVDGPDGTGFKFNNPLEEKAGWDDPTAQRLQQLLDEEINPGIAAHQGYVELLDYTDGTAFVRMGGGCQGCGMASVTLRQGIEQRVREIIPEVQAIVDTTDHAAGTNPYYSPGK